jgi:hypothetical protein
VWPVPRWPSPPPARCTTWSGSSDGWADEEPESHEPEPEPEAHDERWADEEPEADEERAGWAYSHLAGSEAETASSAASASATVDTTA